MTNEDKSLSIAGAMFLTLFTFLMICGVFIAQALGVGILVGMATYIFFDQCYYVKKD